MQLLSDHSELWIYLVLCLCIHCQVDGYLASASTDVDCLANYPVVANAFRKLNCTPATSASVERLFSASAQVLTARRCRMEDKTLDMHIFLRSVLKH